MTTDSWLALVSWYIERLVVMNMTSLLCLWRHRLLPPAFFYGLPSLSWTVTINLRRYFSSKMMMKCLLQCQYMYCWYEVFSMSIYVPLVWGFFNFDDLWARFKALAAFFMKRLYSAHIMYCLYEASSAFYQLFDDLWGSCHAFDLALFFTTAAQGSRLDPTQQMD